MEGKGLRLQANRRSLRQAQGRLFDCASRDKTARGYAQDDTSSKNQAYCLRREKRAALSVRMRARPAKRMMPVAREGMLRCGVAHRTRASQMRMARAKLPSSTKRPKISSRMFFSHFMSDS